MNKTAEEITAELLAPFEAGAVKFKPAVVSGSRAMALPYLDARAIQDRLDQVVGIAGWQDEYEYLADGCCVCRLRVRIGEEWITKMDVGGPSEQPDEGDQRKAALSDALKRAAVKFGVGRYLYRLEAQWVDYDAQKRKFARTPTLPASALPKTAGRLPAKPAARLEPSPDAAPITVDQAMSMDKMLAEKKKPWAAARDWLRTKYPEFPEQGQTQDLNAVQFKALWDAMNKPSKKAS